VKVESVSHSERKSVSQNETKAVIEKETQSERSQSVNQRKIPTVREKIGAIQDNQIKSVKLNLSERKLKCRGKSDIQRESQVVRVKARWSEIKSTVRETVRQSEIKSDSQTVSQIVKDTLIQS
jgi:hypothetical protein